MLRELPAIDPQDQLEDFLRRFKEPRLIEARQSLGDFGRKSPSESIFAFAQAASAMLEPEKPRFALGVFDGEPYLWVIVMRLSVSVTKELFGLKASIETRDGTEFEIHVTPLEGRAVDDIIPDGFSEISF